jgi:hypothetical protein
MEHAMSKHHHSKFPDPADVRPWIDEPDIGSGEKTPAERETEEMIRLIPPLRAHRHEARRDAPVPDEEDTSGVDAGEASQSLDRDEPLDEALERDESLERDEPDQQLDALDPVPPKGR